MTDITLEQRARELLAAEYRQLGERHNVPELIADAETIEAGEEWDFWMDAAHAAVEAALRLSAGADWVLVPREPTPEMIGAGIIAYNGKCEDAYRAMLAAAPRHKTGESDV